MTPVPDSLFWNRPDELLLPAISSKASVPNTVIPPAHILPNRLLAIQLNFQLVALLKRLLTLVTLADAAQSAAGRFRQFKVLKLLAIK